MWYLSLWVILNFGGDFWFQQKLGTKIYLFMEEKLYEHWMRCRCTCGNWYGLKGFWVSERVWWVLNACFSLRWLCCGSLWLWGTRYRYQVFFFSAGVYMGQIKSIKRKQVVRGEITFPNLYYSARGNTGLWNGSTSVFVFWESSFWGFLGSLQPVVIKWGHS